MIRVLSVGEQVVDSGIIGCILLHFTAVTQYATSSSNCGFGRFNNPSASIELVVEKYAGL